MTPWGKALAVAAAVAAALLIVAGVALAATWLLAPLMGLD